MRSDGGFVGLLRCVAILGVAALCMPTSSTAAPTPGPEIDVIPTSVFFSGTEIGSSTSGSFAIINMGSEDLVVSAIEVTSGSDFTVDFGIAAQYCETSTPVIAGLGGRCAVRVRFTPSAEGRSTGEVTISSNDADEPTVIVSLSGTGIAAPAPEIEVDPTYIDFMAVGVGESATREITISNSGPDPLVLGAPLLSNWVDFSLDEYGGTSPCGLAGAVAPDGSCTMTVTFAPTTTDPISALLTIFSNDLDDPTVDVSLVGNRGELTEDCYNSIDDDGNGRIDCADPACYDEIACGVHPCWEVEVVDEGVQCVDIDVGDDGDVHLVYFVPSAGGTGATLRYAVSDPEDSPDWLLEDVDTTTGAAVDCAVIVGPGGDVHIGYVADDALQYATDTSGDWEYWTVAGDVDANTSIALDSSGLPHLSFRSFQEVEVSPGVFEREYSPYYARQLAPGGDFETYNPEFRLFADEPGAQTPYTGRSWYAEVSRIVVDTSDYPHVLFSDAEAQSSALGRVPNWAEGIVEFDQDLFGLPMHLAIGTDDQLHAAGVVPERYVASQGFETVNELVYATHPGGAFPAADGWSYNGVEAVASSSSGPADEADGSLALDSGEAAHFAFGDLTSYDELKYLKVVDDGDGVVSQTTERVDVGQLGRRAGRGAEIAIDSSDQVHVGYFYEGIDSEPVVRYARRIACPGPMPSLSPSRSIFYEPPQSETFYVSNIGVGDLEINTIRFTSGESTTEGDWYLRECAEDHPLDLLEGEAGEPTSVDLVPPVVLGEGEFGVVCVGFDPETITRGMGVELVVDSSAGSAIAELDGGGLREESGGGGGCGCDDEDAYAATEAAAACSQTCSMSSPGGGLDVRALLAFSMFVCCVLLWRKLRLRG